VLNGSPNPEGRVGTSVLSLGFELVG